MRGRSRLAAVAAVLAALAAGAIWAHRWWQWRATHVSTENAYVQATVLFITPRIPGTVLELPVEENSRVRRGDLLARLDPEEYELAVREAEAALAQAVLEVESARARARAAERAAERARAQWEQARRDHERARALLRRGAASQERVEQAATAARVAAAALHAAEQTRDAARAALGIPLDAPAENAPAVRRARAARDRARLALDYTRIHAPADGVVGKQTAHIGERVAPGQPLMRLVRDDTFYVEANFKETQLARVRPGQPAIVVPDSYPDSRIRGTVDSLAPATGAAFALLPPENATGNWIKVVQRLPVRIRLDGDPEARPRLAVGLSARVTIDTAAPVAAAAGTR